MSKFAIEFIPPLPKAGKLLPISLDSINARRVLDLYPHKHDVIYRLENVEYKYYPADIITILNDLHQEWDLARRRISHDMTLSGYTILGVEFIAESAIFFDPLHVLQQGGRKKLIEPIWAVVIEEEFLKSASDIFGIIDGLR